MNVFMRIVRKNAISLQRSTELANIPMNLEFKTTNDKWFRITLSNETYLISVEEEE